MNKNLSYSLSVLLTEQSTVDCNYESNSLLPNKPTKICQIVNNSRDPFQTTLTSNIMWFSGYKALPRENMLKHFCDFFIF